MSLHVANLRTEYERARLRKASIDPNPLVVFEAWLAEAIEAGIHEPNAMTLATADAQGYPSARVVLLKGVDACGFCFYTNYDSRKGQELVVNPHAALVFWWGPLERQIRIEGQVEKLTEAESDAYYATRPAGSRLGAWASPQSTIIRSRAVLEERLRALETEYADQLPARPPYWGGYRVLPRHIEFWQGGPHRLHDRLRYSRQDDATWKIGRLAP